LKQENLNPEIEEKLLQLQRYQEKQMRVESSVASNQTHHNSPAIATPRPPSRKRPLSSSNIPTAIATATSTNTQSSSSGGDDKDDKDWVETPRKRPMLRQENRETIPK